MSIVLPNVNEIYKRTPSESSDKPLTYSPPSLDHRAQDKILEALEKVEMGGEGVEAGEESRKGSSCVRPH